jgi:hypothetical protein
VSPDGGSGDEEQEQGERGEDLAAVFFHEGWRG